MNGPLWRPAPTRRKQLQLLAASSVQASLADCVWQLPASCAIHCQAAAVAPDWHKHCH